MSLRTAVTRRAGLLWGFVGILAFSFTLPFTRVAVGSMDPFFISLGRAVVAGTLALIVLLVVRPIRPVGHQWIRLSVVALGVVVGFPVFTSLALQRVPSAHGTVVIALLPAVTAMFVVLRTKERPSPVFWLASIAGALAVVVFLAASNGIGHFQLADLYLVLAVIAAAAGYTEGGLLSRELGSWQVICWALVLSLPIMAILTGVNMATTPLSSEPVAWLSFAYISVCSMFLGFFAWYRGLAIGPMATVSQVQLVQPVLSLVWCWLILGEELTLPIILGGLIVIAFALTAVRARVKISK